MASTRTLIIGTIVVAAAATAVYLSSRTPTSLVLTGIVTTDDIVVSPMVTGQVTKLLVSEGDSVKQGQLLAVLAADELTADKAFYAQTEQGSAEQVQASEAALHYQEQQTAEQIRQSDAALGAVVAQRDEAVATAANAKTTLDRNEAMLKAGGVSPQEADQARMSSAAAQSRLAAIDKQIEAARATLALARSAAQQDSMRRSAFATARAQHAAAAAQTTKANVRLGYTELHAPITGIVDVSAVRAGEVASAGQPVLTLIDPNAFWVRADVEESYIDRVRLGDSLTVRLPSGETKRGAVIYRGADAAFATQRDVSRSKRDIKTFEIRLRVDNRDRRLALGMTAYVDLPLTAHP
jgi:multidrug resistance efflux pump